MRPRLSLALALAASFAAAPASWAATKQKSPKPAGPTALGEFQSWTAATYEQGGQTVCYAFTRAHIVGGTSGTEGPLLTVTERPASRDEVAITSTAAYPKGAEVMLQVGQTGIDMYTAGHDAFARDPKAAVAAFQRGSQAVVRPQDAHGGHGADTYSLDGFSKAYDAIVKACPPH